MRVLFIHQNMPAQFRHLALALAADSRHQVLFVTTRTDRHLPNVTVLPYSPARAAKLTTHHYLRALEDQVLHGQAVVRVCQALAAKGLTPDVVVGHPGWGELLFVKDVWPAVPLLAYCEYYSRCDPGGIDPRTGEALSLDTQLRWRISNAHLLLSLEAADAGICPTAWQHQLHPPAFRDKIAVIFDGVDTARVRPDAAARFRLPTGTFLTAGDEVITYVARGLEPFRGFPQFVRALPEVLAKRPAARVVIAGDDQPYYGSPPSGGESWRTTLLREVPLDSARVHFVGYLRYAEYLKLLQVSRVHVYLTLPFVLSWSFFEALSAGCLVVASDTAPVREVLVDSQNGLATDLADPQRIAADILRALTHPDRRQFQQAARETILHRYALEQCLPAQVALLERLVNGRARREGISARTVGTGPSSSDNGNGGPPERDAVVHRKVRLERTDAAPEASVPRIAPRSAEAPAACHAPVLADPESVRRRFERATALQHGDRLSEAEAAYREIVSAAPRCVEAIANLGKVLVDQGRLTEAEPWYRRALKLAPRWPEIENSLGALLSMLGHHAEAVALLRRALRRRPEHVGTACNLAYALLRQGELREGWAHYEARWRIPEMARQLPACPPWRGDDPAGRTILLHAEQGLGDTLHFVRYAPLVAARGAHVVLESPHALVRLLRRADGVDRVIARGEPRPPADLHCPVMSLPHVFDTTLATIPAAIPYLAADPADVARWRAWRARVAGNGHRLVGLVWAGQARPEIPDALAIDRRRSLALAALRGLGQVPGVRFVSLQKGTAATQLAGKPASLDLLDPMADVHDFADTAALIDVLDLVIAVDTAVPHLAGALGKPVWLLSRFDACWRWLWDRSDSPWYPTLRLFRQPQPGAWGPVLAEVARALPEWAARYASCHGGGAGISLISG